MCTENQKFVRLALLPCLLCCGGLDLRLSISEVCQPDSHLLFQDGDPFWEMCHDVILSLYEHQSALMQTWMAQPATHPGYTVWPATPGPQAWAARYCMEYCGQCTVWGHTIVIATMSVSDRNLSAPWQSMGPPPYVHAVSQSLTIMQRGTRNYENLVGCHTHCGLPLPCPTPAPCQNSGHNCRL